MEKSIFISYCHEGNLNTDKIHNIADRLETIGLKVVIDKYDLNIGNDVNQFMDALATDEYRAILVMCTSEYKRRADNNIGGVGYETQQYRHRLSDPKQEYIVPIIIEHGDIESLVPQVFPDNPYYVDLTTSDCFENNFQGLVSFLQGVKPTRSVYSELEALIFYVKTDLPGLPKKIRDDYRISMTQYASALIREIRNWKYKFPYHMNASSSIESLNNISENIVEFSHSISEKDIAIDLLSLLWEVNKDTQKHGMALRIIEHAIDIGETDKENQHYKQRYLTLCYQKALSLHSLKRIDKALDLYTMIVSNQENCDILHPAIVLEAVLFKGHTHCLKSDFKKAIRLYEHIISEMDENFKINKDIEVLKYRALNALIETANSLGDEHKRENYKHMKDSFLEHEQFLSELSEVEKINNGMMSPNPLYPPELMLHVRCVQDVPELKITT